MNFSFEVGEKEKHLINFHRNSFWGNVHIKVDGQKVYQSFESFSVHLKANYNIKIGIHEEHDIKIIKTRPLLFAGFRHQQYRIFVDGNLINELEGF